MNHTAKILFAFLLLTGSSVFAQTETTPASMDSIMPDLPRGKLVGQVYIQDKENGPKRLAGKTRLILMVFYSGNQVLVMDKETSDKGTFEFGNIFKDEKFTYVLGSQDGGKIYVYPTLSLKPDQDQKKIDFVIGEGSPFLIPAELAGKIAEMQAGQQAPADAATGGMGSSMQNQTSEKAPFSVSSFWQYPYQKIALVLSGLVLIASLYFIFKSPSTQA